MPDYRELFKIGDEVSLGKSPRIFRVTSVSEDSVMLEGTSGVKFLADDPEWLAELQQSSYRVSYDA